jgi:PAS domain S-box-containing protein
MILDGMGKMWDGIRRGAAGLALLSGWALCSPAGAMPLAQWRAELERARLMGENEVARAALRIVRLAAAVPPEATPADRVHLLNVQARIVHYQGLTDEAGKLADQALAAARQQGDRVGQAEADLVLALNVVNQGRFDRLYGVTTDAVRVLEGANRPDLLADAMLRVGMMYSRFGKPDEMVDTCMRTMDLARRGRDPWALAYGHYCLANAYSTSHNNVQSLEQYRLMQAQARLAGSRLLEGQAVRGQAQQAGNQDSRAAQALARQASIIFGEVGVPFYLAASLYAEASMARTHGDHARALLLLNEVAEIYRHFPNNTGMWWTLTARSSAYLALDKVAPAEADLAQSLALAQKLGLPLYRSESQRLLAALDARRGAYQAAYGHALAAAEQTSEADRKKVSTRVLELAGRYQQEARQRQIAELTRSNAQQRIELREHGMLQRWLWTLLGAIAAGLAVLAFFLLRRRRAHQLLAAANRKLQQSQEALQRQTAILQSVLDSMDDGVAVADQAGRLVLVNPAAERMAGITRGADGVPQRFFRGERGTAWAWDELPLARAVRGATGESGASAEIFMAGGALAGPGRWLRMTARALSGQQAGAVAVIADISERKRAEEEIRALNANLERMVQQRTAQLRQQTRYLRVLIDAIPWWVWFKDTDSRYLAVNRSAARVMGCGTEQVVGKSDFDFKPVEIARAFREDDLKVMRSGRQQTVEEMQRGPAGMLWIEVFKTPVVDEDGSVLGTVGLARDISGRKEAEAARDAALLEAQHLARLRSDFLARMSHELRSPLNAVLGLVQLLQRDGGLTAQQLSSVKGIGHSGEHLLDLINNVLDSARLEASRLALIPKRFALGPFLDGIAGMMRLRAADKGLEFGCELTAGVPATLLADEQRLRQVLLNLLSNAIKFTDQGAVRLSVLAAGPARLRFAVRDSGAGIEAGQLETIFQPFEQVGEAQRRFGGTGLGLAISRQLVRLMESEIQVESQPGVGSLFWFELAVAAEDAVPAAAPPPAMAAVPAAEPLTPPPAEELAALMKLVQTGNMRAILAHTEYLARLDARYRPFAEQLARLARGYRSRALRQLIERHWQPGTA